MSDIPNYVWVLFAPSKMEGMETMIRFNGWSNHILNIMEMKMNVLLVFMKFITEKESRKYIEKAEWHFSVWMSNWMKWLGMRIIRSKIILIPIPLNDSPCPLMVSLMTILIHLRQTPHIMNCRTIFNCDFVFFQLMQWQKTYLKLTAIYTKRRGELCSVSATWWWNSRRTPDDRKHV